MKRIKKIKLSLVLLVLLLPGMLNTAVSTVNAHFPGTFSTPTEQTSTVKDDTQPKVMTLEQKKRRIVLNRMQLTKRVEARRELRPRGKNK